MPENCEGITMPCIKKRVTGNYLFYKGIFITTDNVISGTVNVKKTIKISYLGHTSQDILSMWKKQKVKPARYDPLCELDYADCTGKYLFGDGL